MLIFFAGDMATQHPWDGNGAIDVFYSILKHNVVILLFLVVCGGRGPFGSLPTDEGVILKASFSSCCEEESFRLTPKKN
jgi:hypothetical protein